ncbi:protein Iojap-related [Salix suchowensis]|uniref:MITOCHONDRIAL ASSEMBLY OF RIBOSOMAL LARGE SUBUNIT PROTEIN 1 n=1 Tax=Salix koriyanagi TaxID=2511006 RepID=A0A9Q1AEW1_9ROSI|nr:protein Iojap-related [Salix suchowensis]KAJ6768521.1 MITOCHONDRIAL ASSEMBLY OF RIBOSOMAL LARGE SUBUNIT PROTEIN 1 [Salix koriyanagi]
MLAASLRSRSLHLSSSLLNHSWKPVLSGSSHSFSVESNGGRSLLDLNEIEKVLTDVKADDVKVIPAQKHAEWADYMVIATGRSTWHVKNIAQALIYKAKQKQKGARRMTLPSVEGQEGGKWIVIDSGKVIVHALDEKARAYYNLESLWTSDVSKEEPVQDLDKAYIKIRPKRNNSKRPANRDA